ncbi:hypothetical protein [Paenibacillus senegalensis]|uniref:hypothetical protein n=1 Tax=Paenibacillus senegalensis TaxID=1465766 RepID=UPI000288697F|nr:hypothetical protein [Paenibacillus senegalensis]
MGLLQSCCHLLLGTLLALMGISGVFQPSLPLSLSQEEQQNKITLLIQSSPEAELQTHLEIHSPELAEAIVENERQPLDSIPMTDRSIQLVRNGRTFVMELDEAGNVYDRRTRKQVLLSEEQKAELAGYGELLAHNHYGSLLSWNEADRLLPVNKKFTVLELETGKSFEVQRRAGSDHADVQPLTAKDTAIMKEIYDGEWSWKRKAILVQSDKGWLAASMHGMPHGGDGIPGNKFNGHFCIHFLNSITHKSNHKDPGHQLMVHKAAGEVKTYLRSLNPYELVDSWIAAAHLQQIPIMGYFFGDEYEGEWNNMVDEVQLIRSIRRTGSFPELPDPDMEKDKTDMKLTVETGIQMSGGKLINRKLDFYLSLHDGSWHISRIEGLGKDLDKKDEIGVSAHKGE